MILVLLVTAVVGNTRVTIGITVVEIGVVCRRIICRTIVGIIVATVVLAVVGIVAVVLILLILLILFLNIFRIWKFVVLLPLHSTILKPNFDLSLTQTERVSNFYSSSTSQVPVEVKFFLQF